MPETALYVRVADFLKRQVEAEAKSDGMSVNQWIVKLISSELQSRKDYRAFLAGDLGRKGKT